jgi:hypothetical protein
MAKEYEEICCEIIVDSAEALLLSDGTHEEWIPKSLIKNLNKDWEPGNAYIFEVEEWKLKDAGFI